MKSDTRTQTNSNRTQKPQEDPSTPPKKHFTKISTNITSRGISFKKNGKYPKTSPTQQNVRKTTQKAETPVNQQPAPSPQRKNRTSDRQKQKVVKETGNSQSKEQWPSSTDDPNTTLTTNSSLTALKKQQLGKSRQESADSNPTNHQRGRKQKS